MKPSRRALLLMPPAAWAGAAAASGSSSITREVFLASPRKGTGILAHAWYTRPSGGDMMSIEQRWSRSDTIDVSYYRVSRDSGKTWSEPVERATGEKRPDGMLRRHLRGGWVDPRTGRHLEFWNEGVLETDDPLEGLRKWRVYYTVGGGPEPAPAQMVMHKGMDPEHPLPGVWHGKNSVMLGDIASQPLAGKDGSILLPLGIAPLTPDGTTLYNPTGAYTYHDAAVAIGRWRGGGAGIEWELGERVVADPASATRGMDEPTLAHLTRGRILMVMRGSNDRRHELPSYRWFSISRDGGRRWSRPAPWTYSNGEHFFSPSACSQLLHHPGNGKLYWLGNIVPLNPRGNRPRYPFVIGEVDRDSGLLIRDSVRVVDDKGPGDDPILTLSNFYARHDRVTGGIALHMTRLFAFKEGWEGDAMLYRIPV
jgi:hypothetical protein